MGDWFQTLVDVEATPEEAQSLALQIVEWLVGAEIVVPTRTDCALAELGHAPGSHYGQAVMTADPRLLRLRTNGMALHTTRTVFDSGQGGLERISCSHCGAAVAWDDLADTIEAWYDTGVGDRSCTRCRRTLGLNDWRWEPEWGFGYLGFEFWNWPELRPEFVAEVSARLGHRVVYVAGKL